MGAPIFQVVFNLQRDQFGVRCDLGMNFIVPGLVFRFQFQVVVNIPVKTDMDNAAWRYCGICECIVQRMAVGLGDITYGCPPCNGQRPKTPK